MRKPCCTPRVFSFKILLIKCLIVFDLFGWGFANFYPVNAIISVLLIIGITGSWSGGFLIITFVSTALYVIEANPYFIFNVACAVAIGYVLIFKRRLLENHFQLLDLVRFVRLCGIAHLTIMIIQFYTGSSLSDYVVSPAGRAAGFRPEPSMSAGFVLLLLGLSAAGKALSPRQYSVAVDMLLCASIVLLSWSFSAVAAFVASLIAVVLMKAGSSARVIFVVLGLTVLTVVMPLSGAVFYAVTESVGSWRSIPDAAVLQNWQQFFLPNFSGDIRERLGDAVGSLSASFLWVDSTYSSFSAFAATFGLGAFLLLLLFSMWGQKAHVVPLIFTVLFLTPKYDGLALLSLALLLPVVRCSGEILHRRRDLQPKPFASA